MEFVTGTTGMPVYNYIGSGKLFGSTYAIFVEIWSCLCTNTESRVNQGKFALYIKSFNHFTGCTKIIYTGKIY